MCADAIGQGLHDPPDGSTCERSPLTILYRDDVLVAVHKPSGLLVHRTALDPLATRFALQQVRDQIGQPVWPVHRLDRGTSGVLLFALDRDSAAVLGRQFESGQVRKRYVAIVRGHPVAAGVIDHPLSRDVDDEGRAVPARDPAQRSAVTAFRTLATVELPVAVDRYPASRYALVELVPQTGRRHQLRRHMKHVSHPIIGDSTWGKGRHNRFFAERFGNRRLLLACTELAIRHPRSGDDLRIECRPDADFLAVAMQLGWGDATWWSIAA